MKKILFSLLVVGTTFGAYALTHRASQTYYLNSDTNKYELSAPVGTACALESSPGCTLQFDGINLPTVPFDKNAIPTSSDYTITPHDVNQSYQ